MKIHTERYEMPFTVLPRGAVFMFPRGLVEYIKINDEGYIHCKKGKGYIKRDCGMNVMPITRSIDGKNIIPSCLDNVPVTTIDLMRNEANDLYEELSHIRNCGEMTRETPLLREIYRHLSITP